MRAGDEVTEIGSCAAIVLEPKPFTAAGVVLDGCGLVDGSGAAGMPVHAVEDKQDDTFLAGFNRPFLQAKDVGLVKVLGLRVGGFLRQKAV